MRYVVVRKFLQHVICLPGYHTFTRFSRPSSRVLGLNAHDSIQDIFGSVALVTKNKQTRVNTRKILSSMGIINNYKILFHHSFKTLIMSTQYIFTFCPEPCDILRKQNLATSTMKELVLLNCSSVFKVAYYGFIRVQEVYTQKSTFS